MRRNSGASRSASCASSAWILPASASIRASCASALLSKPPSASRVALRGPATQSADLACKSDPSQHPGCAWVFVSLSDPHAAGGPTTISCSGHKQTYRRVGTAKKTKR